MIAETVATFLEVTLDCHGPIILTNKNQPRYLSVETSRQACKLMSYQEPLQFYIDIKKCALYRTTAI